MGCIRRNQKVIIKPEAKAINEYFEVLSHNVLASTAILWALLPGVS